MKTYNVWITLFSPSARNAGIICQAQRTRSSWATGKLEYIPINDGSQVNFQFTARDDNAAFAEVTRLFNERNPRNRRPLSGKSYIRYCRTMPEPGMPEYLAAEQEALASGWIGCGK